MEVGNIMGWYDFEENMIEKVNFVGIKVGVVGLGGEQGVFIQFW